MKTDVIPFKAFVNGTWNRPKTVVEDLREIYQFVITGWTPKDLAFLSAIMVWCSVLAYGVKVGIESGFIPVW